MYIKWGSIFSGKFHVTNGVRQGGVLPPPLLFNVSVNELSECLNISGIGRSMNTVDYAIFLRRLQNLYGVEQLALQWFTSYLTDRTHQVCINNTLSEPQSLQCGVPQGSVLGARLYSMYVYLLSSIIVKHNLLYHSYADDTQIYLQCDNNDDAIKEAIHRLEKCIADVCSWMKNNSLKN